MASTPFLNFVYTVVLVLGWVIVIGLFVFFIRKVPKDGPDPGPHANLDEVKNPQED